MPNEDVLIKSIGRFSSCAWPVQRKLDAGYIDLAAHPLNLTVGPCEFDLGKMMLAAAVLAANIEHMFKVAGGMTIC